MTKIPIHIIERKFWDRKRAESARDTARQIKRDNLNIADWMQRFDNARSKHNARETER